MQGSLRLHGGVLYVGRHNLTAEVASYDLGGRPLETRFTFKDATLGRSAVSGLDIDSDRRVWVADGAAAAIRCFTLFGQEVAAVQDEDVSPRAAASDRKGLIGRPVDLRVVGEDDDTTLVVASQGARRHALQVLHIASGRGRSIAPLGDPEARFQRIRGMDWLGEELAVVEAGARRIQVFEGSVTGRMVFRFAYAVPESLGEPEAIALVGDGRMVVATAGEASGVFLFDAGGRCRAQLAADGATAAGRAAAAEVDQPSALALDREGGDRDARLCVLDRDGERIQLLSLDGRSFGSVLESS